MSSFSIIARKLLLESAEIAQAQKPRVVDLLVVYLNKPASITSLRRCAIGSLCNALAKSVCNGGIPLLVRREAGTAFMADGHASESGKIGCCCSACGPKAANLFITL
ncbi:thiamine pyrophosphate-binding protein [Candidatus Methylospira mobilis]|uniref:thiamine pyrophosphate-binding protein n=1 Tax=Candidatus Methylospira mobilis TaxID=1808979 RepID=UPI0028E6DE29|nr:thiamine pyrophosphate-binding protein [Candidatus Methylospira mobilis]WNV03617.1 thiamine pyrophosphate-binding protein [Candidatus Methylospira mobilis]